MTALLEIYDVRKSYGSREVLKGVSLRLDRGKVMCLIGPSGAGKSTLLRCINHLERVDSGLIVVDGELIAYRYHDGRLNEMRESEIAVQRSRIGMVFQHFNLFSHLTALENIAIGPMKIKGVRREEARALAQRLLDEVGLSDKASAYPAQLSGGQAQRVGIARALAMEPALLLFDEPTSALDPELVGDVLEVMSHLADRGMTMLVVTHEMDFARAVADMVVFMADGSIVEAGSADEVLSRPKMKRTHAFLAPYVGRSG